MSRSVYLPFTVRPVALLLYMRAKGEPGKDAGSLRIKKIRE
jgi:hypothetical protein